MQHEFESVFRKWAERPSGTRADDAGRAVVAGIAEGEQRFRLTPALTTLAAASLVLIAAAASFVHSLPPTGSAHGGEPVAGGAPVVSRAPVPARDADVVLWLDDGTPVYVFLPDATR